ncbi:hypothetical protein CLV40_111107 [Actinokineospora auranticolor]|uniref:Uncharacterized protein n=1 Tax=Actinokineospora auranticolor TaxID=155976 RepID=A0A2S6GLU5_9PSEU|nr:hypothetical protein CLV40_111107 [Actinokineospora auranticolor]
MTDSTVSNRIRDSTTRITNAIGTRSGWCTLVAGSIGNATPPISAARVSSVTRYEPARFACATRGPRRSRTRSNTGRPRAAPAHRLGRTFGRGFTLRCSPYPDSRPRNAESTLMRCCLLAGLAVVVTVTLGTNDDLKPNVTGMSDHPSGPVCQRRGTPALYGQCYQLHISGVTRCSSRGSPGASCCIETAGVPGTATETTPTTLRGQREEVRDRVRRGHRPCCGPTASARSSPERPGPHGTRPRPARP